MTWLWNIVHNINISFNICCEKLIASTITLESRSLFSSFLKPEIQTLVLQDAVRLEQERQETIDQKLERLESSLENLSTRFARLLSDYNSTQLKLKQRVTKVEKILSRDCDAISSTSVQELDTK